MAAFVKVAFGTGAVIGVPSAMYLGISHGQKEKTTSIKDLVAQNHSIVLISKNEETRGAKIGDEYVKKNTNKIKDSGSLDGGDHTKTQTRLPSLETKCSLELLREVKSVEDSAYRDFITGCTREVEFQDKLGREGYKPIAENDQSEDTGTNNFNEYKKASNKLKIHGLEIGEGEQYSKQSNKLKEGCKTALSKPISDEDYSKTFEAIKRGCTTK